MQGESRFKSLVHITSCEMTLRTREGNKEQNNSPENVRFMAENGYEMTET